MSNHRRVRVRWLEGYRTEIDIRGVHQINSDETPRYGGEDVGPMPTELLLASVASCMCQAIYHVARKRRLTLNTLEIGAWADKDPSTFRFHEIHLAIESDLSPDVLDDLVNRAKGYCFVSNTVIQGCPIHIATASTVRED